jgi:hypothetical protein
MRTPHRWLRVTVADFNWIYDWSLKLAQLCRPAVIQPPIVPGDINRLAENPRDAEAIDRIHRRLFG